MRKMILSFMLLLSAFFFSGCDKPETITVTSKNPDAEETLSLDKNADIFQWKDVIYKTDIDWVNDLELTKKEVVGEITSSYESDPNTFRNGMANKLPLGAKIYSAEERGDILIVEYGDNVKLYLAIVEG